MIDILYVSYNRLAYTRETFSALIANTDWDEVEGLFVHDAGSTDGTWDYLLEAFDDVPVTVTPRIANGTGPVAAMNWYLDNASEVECDACEGTGDGYHLEGGTRIADPGACPTCLGSGLARIQMYAKIDNDMVVCPGWLGEMLRVTHLYPGLDILGMEPMKGPAIPGHARREYEEARHIGGKGLIRLRSFDKCRPSPAGRNGYQGFTQWQEAHPEVSKGWIRPELPVFGLDQLPFEPWRSLADEYERQQWARRWGEYPDDMVSYWDWWTPAWL